ALHSTNRNGSIAIQYSKYDGGLSTTSAPVFTGNRSQSYTAIGYSFGYNKTENRPYKFANTAVSCWNELERVNDNVFALYTHVPGLGFSKYFITAVKPNNAVSNLKVAQSWNPNGDPVHTLTWTPQTYDRSTMHTYEVWYRKKKVGASSYEDKKTIGGTSREVWMFAGKASVKYNGATDSTTTSSGNRSGIMPNKTFYNSYTAESCKFEFVAPRGDNGDGTKYDRTYEYLVIPVYDASSHRGTEASTSIVTEPAPSKIYGNLYQVTEKNANGETLYGFSIRLDPYFLPGAKGSTEAKRLIITSAGGEEGSDKLEDAMSVTLEDGTPLTPLDGITFQTTSSGGTITHGAYALSIDITGKVGPDGKLPSIIWHNVNPNLVFQLAAHIESTSTYQYSGTGNLSTTLIVPGASTNMTAAQVQPLDGDYSGMQGDEDLPLGAKLKTGSDEVTNKVTLMSANTFGTKMSVINPLYVTNEVLQNWNIQYTYHILKNDAEVATPIVLAASNEEGGAGIYSNSATVVADVLGLPILKTDWDTHTVLDLNDAEKATNDNLVKQNYNSATANDVYKTKVDVSYTRKTNAVTASKTDGPTSTITMPTESPFKELNIDYGTSLGALFQRTSSHFDMDAPESNGHYYPYYYDAAIQFIWGDYTDNLNKYIGFHAVSGIDCVGHYENASSTTWTQYYAGSVLSDTYVAEYNKTLKNSGVDEFMAAIGYDGTNGTDWSALASEKRTLPMNIHYVWGGDTWLASDDETGRKGINMSALVSADYPVIEGITLKVNQYVDGKNYSMISETATFAEPTTTMNVVSVPKALPHFTVDHTTTVTGIEGIITNACGGWQLYPNPVGSEFTLQAPMTIGNVQIFTMDGQLVKVVKDVKDTTVKINVDELPQGVYIVNTLGVAKMMIKM
ncbi:MAG: T9SS type A sorting domain-containing protein, partial [Muribaculaceae bacterium]|nr:T9SS type A sorting domain-containing protein [Muribaculaceae bacterium]